MTDQSAGDLHARRTASLARIDKLSWWLDDAFEIPLIRKRIGVDGIIGLIPFIGDFVGLGLSSLMIGEALRLGAPRRLWLRMGANIGVDFLVGLVPVAGDIFDVAFKANRRNQKLMQAWLQEVTGQADDDKKWWGGTTLLISLAAALVVSIGLWRAVFG